MSRESTDEQNDTLVHLIFAVVDDDGLNVVAHKKNQQAPFVVLLLVS